LHGQGKIDEAAESLRTAILLNPDYLDALRNLGMVELERNRPEEAIRNLSRALQLAPGDTETAKELEEARRLAAQTRFQAQPPAVDRSH